MQWTRQFPRPGDGSDPVPVFAEATTSSSQIGTVPGGGIDSSCGAGVGAAYDLCGGGTLWYRALGGFVPYACVTYAW
jgi:hypothetical protein